MNNNNSSNYFYGTMRGDGYAGIDADNDICPLEQHRDHVIDTEFFPVIDENKDK